MSVYTHSKRVAFYAELASHVKYQELNILSVKELNEVFQTVYDVIVPKYWKDSPRLPKSSLALLNQMRWCTTTQKISDKMQAAVQAKNRLAAYEGGWIRMTDILNLEKITQEKNGI